ncbi:molybdopterin cofactor-binding domain-containing protein [Sphingomonas sp. G-3-2-10]|uniref:xanthine dehydrogenase family protein molybdopterin-binding subunit n=1 Tax=Sphingomonas sp. G-3-2-10 TaxID=2728838 RepID=UPI00146C4078|nr:molybdopterin cofactor-binding domain-containing protein [Sphingomonas sp. G-3-2-10]NML07060.1 xanthine dehydrogenase family protein molybdopterin-binding subunit [Sphingomonas sp. G-3-2-10]
MADTRDQNPAKQNRASKLLNEGLSRRSLLIGGGAGVGLLLAWAVWPRTYLPNLTADSGETLFGAWLKIGTDGHITVAVPQAELGQGVFTAFPQIVADELGAAWSAVGVEAAPLNPLYANALGAATLFEAALGGLSESLQRTHATRSALVLTGGSSSIRNFEETLRKAGAAARAMLCKAAARQWGVDWQACGTANGEVIHGNQKLRFGEIAAAAASEDVPNPLPMRGGEANRLYGQKVPRLDAPSKVDGSVNFAGDVRLENMVFASIRQGPVGTAGLAKIDEAAANKVLGMRAVVKTERWVAAVADNWWAADRAIDAMKPRFQVPGDVVNDDTIADALTAALDGEGKRIAETGDLAAQFKGARLVSAEYRVGLALHAPIEPMTCTANYADGRMSLWLPSQAPGLARAAAARAAGLSEDSVTVYPMMAGGSFGAKLEHAVAEQAAVIAKQIGRPVQLTWSRVEDFRHDCYRPAAAARMAGKLGPNKSLAGWLAKIAAPSAGRELSERLLGGDPLVAATLAVSGGDPSAVAGAIPAYAIPNYAVDHHPAAIGVPSGHWRSDAHSYTAFFNESFIDELAHVAESDAVTFRMAMLGSQPRLARCLQLAAQLGNWQGGAQGSGQGIACHSFRGSHIAVLAEARLGAGRKVKVERMVAVVDVGRVVNPDLVEQQIEGGLIFGMAAAIGGSTGFTDNVASVMDIADLNLPRLADMPDITVEIIRSDADPGGVGELGVPAVAPAIANALQAATGVRFRALPLLSDVE